MANASNLSRFRWITVIGVSVFLLVFEYIRHVQFPQLLHSLPIYLLSVAAVGISLLLFNEWVFRSLQKSQTTLLHQMETNTRLQDELKEQANRLNTIIESSGNAVITMDREGRILSWNRAAEAIYGWRKNDVIGKRYQMVPPELQEETKKMIQRLLAGETIYNCETVRLRENGERIPVLLTASPICDAAGSVTGFLGISTDLRERKQLEQAIVQQQRMLATLEERDRLARELHDGLGQVLGFMNTQSQAIRELLLRGDEASALACLKELTEVAQDAHADVRDYILSLKSDTRRESLLVDLRAYLDRYGRLTGIKTRLNISEALGSVSFSPEVEMQLMRIIQEALTNARKHAHAKNMVVSIQPDEQGLVVNMVDDGAGFDMQQFDQDDGRHFGMRIMRERAATCGCRIDIHSEQGKGTQVSVTVPSSKLQQKQPSLTQD